MPLAIDPQNTFRVWLDSDADIKPRPEFEFRYLTGRQFMAIVDLRDGDTDNIDSGSELLESIYKAMSESLCQLPHMGDHSITELPDLLTMPETMELFDKMLAGSMPDGETLGK